jgi:hypothetical protein
VARMVRNSVGKSLLDSMAVKHQTTSRTANMALLISKLLNLARPAEALPLPRPETDMGITDLPWK